MKGTPRACLAAEAVKARKSWHLLVAILGPLCQVGFLGLVCWYSEDRVRAFRPGFRFWVDLNAAAWNLLVMPLVAALVCDLGWDLDREAGAWRFLRAQPVPAWQLALAKGALLLGLMVASTLLLFAALPPVGLLLRRNPALLMGDLPSGWWLRLAGWSLLTLPAAVAFQSLLSLLRPGVWPALSAALAGTWLAQRALAAPLLGALLPWGLAAHTSIVFERWRALPWGLAPRSWILALGLGLLALLAFRAATRRRD